MRTIIWVLAIASMQYTRDVLAYHGIMVYFGKGLGGFLLLAILISLALCLTRDVLGILERWKKG